MTTAIATFFTLFLVLVAIAIHYEVLNITVRFQSSMPTRRFLGVSMVVIITTHFVEIFVFALAYWLLHILGEYGSVKGAVSFPDFLYYSAVVYTTVGFGDVYPLGSMRIITAAESLVGLALITWSASFTYVWMSRAWVIEDRISPND